MEVVLLMPCILLERYKYTDYTYETKKQGPVIVEYVDWPPWNEILTDDYRNGIKRFIGFIV